MGSDDYFSNDDLAQAIRSAAVMLDSVTDAEALSSLRFHFQSLLQEQRRRADGITYELAEPFIVDLGQALESLPFLFSENEPERACDFGPIGTSALDEDTSAAPARDPDDVCRVEPMLNPPEQSECVSVMKRVGNDFIAMIRSAALPEQGAEAQIATRKVEEAVMWATKAATV